jgi:hypothetical protein
VNVYAYSQNSVTSILDRSGKSGFKYSDTDLDAPYSAGNFDIVYDGKGEAKITFITNLNFKEKFTKNQRENFTERFKSAVAAWDKAAQIEILDTNGKVLKTVALRFEIKIVDESERVNKETEIHPKGTTYSALTALSRDKDREIVMIEANLGIESEFKTLVHEFGHILGLEDEYDDGRLDWINPASPRPFLDSPDYTSQDFSAIMNMGEEFRPRYFNHFAKAILAVESASHYFKSEVHHSILENRVELVTYGSARIRLLKSDINGNSSTQSEVVQFELNRHVTHTTSVVIPTTRAYGVPEPTGMNPQRGGTHRTLGGGSDKYY